jgi:tetratricopeptide (TPR) repeat protein
LTTIALWVARRRARAPLATWLLYCAALAPALGFVDVFPFRYSYVADHFAYLATIPVAALAGWAGAEAVRRMGLTAPLSTLIAVVVLGVPMAALSRVHAEDFEGPEQLYRATLARNPDAWMANNNLALILMADGRTTEARERFMEALRLDPAVPETQLNAGRLLIGEGSLVDGIAHVREAIRLGADTADAHNNIGVGLLRQGNAAGALAEFEAALARAAAHAEARANLAEAHQQLGVADARAGRLPQAVAHFEAVVRIARDGAVAHYNLGTAYLATGRTNEGVSELREALRLNPSLTQARATLESVHRHPQ